jgi:hypothetical protein
MLHRHGPLLALVATLIVSGCAAPYVSAPLPVTHPASPTAPEAPAPPPSQVFTTERLSPTPKEEKLKQNPHAGHSAMQGMHGGH